ncbi:ABC transporter permease [Candidatus Poriferisodalis sp.]|uniref:ABC transporter permease n=1 Tax=Candidatus Poriferisodalis sp. TaxID=3101277 RepID=UPI003B015CC5
MASTLLIARNELRLLQRDPFPLFVLIGMPGVLLFFVTDALIGGPAHSVPALASLFALMGTGSMGFSFFREHGWGTWDRLRVAPVRTIELVAGKAIPMLAVTAAQQLIMVAIGIAVFSLDVPGGAAQLIITALVCAAMYVALAIALTSLCRTMSQLNAASMLGTMAIAGAGGAIAKIAALPGWVQAIAPASPVYWVSDAYRSVLNGEQGFGRAIAMLVGFAALFTAITLWQFRAHKPKEGLAG